MNNVLCLQSFLPTSHSIHLTNTNNVWRLASRLEYEHQVVALQMQVKMDSKAR